MSSRPCENRSAFSQVLFLLSAASTLQFLGCEAAGSKEQNPNSEQQDLPHVKCKVEAGLLFFHGPVFEAGPRE